VAAYRRAIASDDYRLHLRSTMRAARGVMRRPMQRHVRRVASPTLIMWGARDYLLPVTAARQLQRLIPGARLVIYSQSGHCPMVDQPDRWNRDVQDFLDGFPVGRCL
jgi:pimeloyl-ACP methyl ester carboxylesterase